MSDFEKHQFVDYASIHFVAAILSNPDCVTEVPAASHRAVILGTCESLAKELYGRLHQQPSDDKQS